MGEVADAPLNTLPNPVAMNLRPTHNSGTHGDENRASHPKAGSKPRPSTDPKAWWPRHFRFGASAEGGDPGDDSPSSGSDSSESRGDRSIQHGREGPRGRREKNNNVGSIGNQSSRSPDVRTPENSLLQNQRHDHRHRGSQGHEGRNFEAYGNRGFGQQSHLSFS